MIARPLTLIGIAFLTVALVVSFFSAEEGLLVGILLGALGILGLVVLDGRARKLAALMLLSGAVAALSYAGFANREYNLSEFDNDKGQITGTVKNIEKGGSSTAYTVEVTGSDIVQMPMGFKALLYSVSDKDIGINDIIVADVTVKALSSTPSFDMGRFYRSDGISVNLMTYNSIDVLEKGKHDLFYYAKQINLACCKIVDKNLTAPYSGLIKAILLGDKSDIDRLIYHKITKSGISHIFVVSGLHISLLSMMAFALLKLIRVPLKVRSGLTILVAWGFVLITGLGLPGIRAAIMMTVMMSAKILERNADTLSSLFLAGIIIVLLNPAAVISGSFLLSFSATLGVILLARPIEIGINKKLRLFNNNKGTVFLRKIVELLSLTLASNIAMLPVIIYVFKGISIASPIANIIAVPLMPFLLVGSLLLLLLGSVPILAYVISGAVKLILDIILFVCGFVSSLDFAYLGLNYNFVYIWLWVAIILIVAACLFTRKKEVMRNTAFISFGALILCFFLNTVYNRGNLQISTINGFDAQTVVVSQGDTATIISFGDDNYMDVSVENFLRSKNISRIDNYIFTSKEKKSIDDSRFLAAVTDIHNIFLPEGDELADYAQEIFNPQNGVYTLKDNGYDITDRLSTKISIDHTESGVVMSIAVGQTKIAITNSPDAASEANCEILYYCGKYDKKVKQNKAKYVIILEEFIPKRLNQDLTAMKAYEQQITLSIRQNGSYRFG